MKKLLDEIINSGKFQSFQIGFINGIKLIRSVDLKKGFEFTFEEDYFIIRSEHSTKFIPYSKIAYIEAFETIEVVVDVLEHLDM